MGLVYLQTKNYPEAEKQFQKIIQLTNRPDGKTGLAMMYALSGKKDQAHTTLDELLKGANNTYIAPCLIAQVYSVLNERDQAFLWLEKAREVRDTNIVNLKMDPLYRNLRSDPR